MTSFTGQSAAALLESTVSLSCTACSSTFLSWQVDWEGIIFFSCPRFSGWLLFLSGRFLIFFPPSFLLSSGCDGWMI